jgi:hypothetical protein
MMIVSPTISAIRSLRRRASREARDLEALPKVSDALRIADRASQPDFRDETLSADTIRASGP